MKNHYSSTRQQGQASVEYLCVCVVLVLALGIGLSTPNSVLWQLIEAFQSAYQRFSFSLSIPL